MKNNFGKKNLNNRLYNPCPVSSFICSPAPQSKSCVLAGKKKFVSSSENSSPDKSLELVSGSSNHSRKQVENLENKSESDAMNSDTMDDIIVMPAFLKSVNFSSTPVRAAKTKNPSFGDSLSQIPKKITNPTNTTPLNESEVNNETHNQLSVISNPPAVITPGSLKV